MPDVIRTLGLLAAVVAVTSLIYLGKAKPGTTGFATPWRYWGVAAGLLIEGSGIFYRLNLWGTPFNMRDLIFLAINICIVVSCLGTLTALDPKGER